MRKMKKVMAAMLAATMAMSMSLTAFATTPNIDEDGETKITQPGMDGEYGDAHYVTFNKKYSAPWSQGSPAETFTFTVKQGADVKVDGKTIHKTIESNSEATYPATNPSVESAVFQKNDATKDGALKTLKIDLPVYSRVGIYYYTINEDIPKVDDVEKPTTGVEYHTDDIVLKVTVIEQNGKIRVGAVHCENPATDVTSSKTGEIENIYKASGLEITKKVDGIMGDHQAYFTVNVTLTAPDNTNMKSEITVQPLSYEKDDDDPEDDAYNPTTITSMGTYTFKIRHDETINMDNIPAGVTYTVSEVEANADGYTTKIEYSDEAKKIDTEANDTVTITNTKGGTVDTGINLDNAPYILLLAMAALGMFGFVSKKRTSEF
ncbi:MAG: DUF5979 domain-containing protein [Lachnospiraceae bacterium]|nr:DUF5979 domain-containing protein [Lachnospiraceae bacterium]